MRQTGISEAESIRVARRLGGRSTITATAQHRRFRRREVGQKRLSNHSASSGWQTRAALVCLFLGMDFSLVASEVPSYFLDPSTGEIEGRVAMSVYPKSHERDEFLDPGSGILRIMSEPHHFAPTRVELRPGAIEGFEGKLEQPVELPASGDSVQTTSTRGLP